MKSTNSGGELRRRCSSNVSSNSESAVDQDRDAMNESVTDIPASMLNGDKATERTPMPIPNSIFRMHSHNPNDNQNNSSSTADLPEHDYDNDNDNDNDSCTESPENSMAPEQQQQQQQEHPPNQQHTYDSNSQNKRVKGAKNKQKQESNSGATKSAAPATSTSATSKTVSGAQVPKHDEKKRTKITTRIVFGFCMFGVFSGSVYMGHVYICLLVAAIECLLFRELVRVRYSAYFHTIQNTIPLFRTTQWMWFAVAIFYTYGDFVLEIIQRNPQLHYLLPYAQYAPSIAFILYSGTFVVTITTLQREHIKFQLNQSCWTVLVLMLTVGQLKYIMHNIFNGLIWFVLPCCLVFCNDITAYITGMMYGRKFIRRPFLSVSPNKTWEGFMGGWFFTMIAAWYLGRFLAQFTWMTCPTNEFRIFPVELSCPVDPIFTPVQSIFKSHVFELLPQRMMQMIPHMVPICSVQEGDGDLTRCVPGDESQVHDHFEWTITDYYPIQVHAVWLALFASLVAPFGGFLASAIKRAYGIKDFDSIIPGHGGVMDRMDCQFLMALCTWVHYNTFVKLATVSVPKLTYMYSLLSEQEKKDFLLSIATGTSNISLSDYAF